MRLTKKRLRFFFLNMFYRNLWVQIAAFIIIIVSIPIAFLGILMINNSQKAVKDSISNSCKQIVVRAAAEVELFIKNPEDILVSIAAIMSRVFDDTWKQETILVELVLDNPVFNRVFSVNMSGDIIADSDFAKKKWVFSDEILEAAKKGKNYRSEVMFSKDHTPYLLVAVPLIIKGKTAAVLAGNLNMRGVWDIVDGIRIGKTGRALLVSDTGMLIAHPDKKLVLKNINFKNKKDVMNVLKGERGAIEFEDENGGKWVSSYAPIPELGWGIILRQKQEEAYLFSKIMKMNAWIIILLAEIMIIALSIFMAKRLVRPIKMLIFKLNKINNGESIIRTRRHDEIGEIIKSFNNITNRLKAAESKEQFSRIGEVAAEVAHELKNSLVAIKAFIQLFPKRRNDEKFITKFNKLLPGEIDRWENMVKELSDFSARPAISKIETDIKMLICNLIEVLDAKLKEKNIQASFISCEKEIKIMIDPERIKQVLINLIINSVKAMPDGGKVIISADLYSEKQGMPVFAEVKVQDTGQGMPSEIAQKIFEPFYSGKKGGIGLGLSISRRIIEQHGGTISVESELGKGAIFKILLPQVIEKCGINGEIKKSG